MTPVECKLHGMQITIHVSKDIFDNIYNNQFEFMPVIVFYEYDGEIIESFYLSREYSEKYKLKHNQVISLPDNYPQWDLDLCAMCYKCLKNILDDEYFTSDKYKRGEWVI